MANGPTRYSNVYAGILRETRPDLSPNTACVQGNVYYHQGRWYLCTVGGTTGNSINPTHVNYRYVTSDTFTPTVYTTGSASFVDITGRADYGWDACVPNNAVLFQVSGPNLTSDYQRKSTLMATEIHKIFMCHESTIVSDLHLNRMWDVGAEVYNPGGAWAEPAMDPSGMFIEVVSVDRNTDLPTHGAKWNCTSAGEWDGYARLSGFDILVTNTQRVGGGWRCVANLWFDSCNIYFDYTGLECVNYRNFNNYDSSLIALTFTDCHISLMNEADFLLCGFHRFENTVFVSNNTSPFIRPLRAFSEIDFKGCDFSGCSPTVPLVDVSTSYFDCSITLEGCTGLTSAMLDCFRDYINGNLTITLSGCEIDGVKDVLATKVLTDRHEENESFATYRVNSSPDAYGRKVSYRFDTRQYLMPPDIFTELTKLVVPVSSDGLYEVEVFLLLPENEDFTTSELWGICSYPGTSFSDDTPRASFDIAEVMIVAPPLTSDVTNTPVILRPTSVAYAEGNIAYVGATNLVDALAEGVSSYAVFARPEGPWFLEFTTGPAQTLEYRPGQWEVRMRYRKRGNYLSSYSSGYYALTAYSNEDGQPIVNGKPECASADWDWTSISSTYPELEDDDIRLHVVVPTDDLLDEMETSEGAVGMLHFYGDTGKAYSDSAEVWESSSGYKSVSMRGVIRAKEPGNLLISIYCAKPNVTLFVCPSVRVAAVI